VTKTIDECIEKMRKLGLVDDDYISDVYAMYIDFLLEWG